MLSHGFTFEEWWYLGGTSLLLLVQNVVIKQTSGTLPVPGKRNKVLKILEKFTLKSNKQSINLYDLFFKTSIKLNDK